MTADAGITVLRRYDFALGPAYMGKKGIAMPLDAGTTFGLFDSGRLADPGTTAVVVGGCRPGKAHGFWFGWGPYRVGRQGQLEWA